MDWFEAARTGAIEHIEAHLANGQDLRQPDESGRTALRVAVEHGRAEVVTLLLARGADPNLDGAGARPLKAALENEHWDVAAALVRRGADPNADGVASIVIAAPPKRQLLALMLKHGLDPNGAHPDFGPYVQFALNDAACCDMLFEAGFDLARYEREVGETLLERALSTDRARFEQLLKLRADVNLPIDRRSRRTLLMHLAEEEPAEEVHGLIRSLVKRGADVEQPDAEGRTAIDVARERDHGATVALLTRLRDAARRARVRADEAARLAAEAEALRLKRSEAAKKAAETRRLAAAKKARAVKRAAAAAKKPVKRKIKPVPKRRANKSSKPRRPAPAKRPTRPKPAGGKGGKGRVGRRRS